MKRPLKSKAIFGRPMQGIFVGKDKYLKLQHHIIEDITPPISEKESLFLLVKAGFGNITINGVEFAIAEGSFLWLQSYHTFSIQSLGEQPIELSLCVYDYPLASFLTFRHPNPEVITRIMHSNPLMQLEGDTRKQVYDLFEDFEEENPCCDPGSSLIKVSILGQFAKLFVDKSLLDLKNETQEEMPLGWNAILYMSDHFALPLTAQSVAQEFNTDSSTLNRELRAISGQSFNQILNNIRVNIAISSLLYEDMPLSLIASSSGFPTEASFYRSFKKMTGTSPLEYRKKYLLQEEPVYRGMIMGNSLMKILIHAFSSFNSVTDLEDTSRDLYLSTTTIRDLLHRDFELNYYDISTLPKIRHAEALLLTTDLPVLDIAVSVGFNSSRSFYRSFKKMHNMTPSQFRKKQLKKTTV